MSKLHNIQSVAKYESKLLMRSWFYRIFLILAVLFLCIFNIGTLIVQGGSMWLMKALPANIPYINLLFLNTGQAIIAVFLSSEFLKSDKKLDTSEVFYVHPLSNAEYVIGKIWGNLAVFIRLDLIIMLMVVVFNIASGTSIDWGAYLIYFFLICVATLVFIFGLSVALMLVVKNQAITFVVLLGYIALTLFYIGDKFYYLFDYMVYSLPLTKSTVIGFSNMGTLLNHRMIYFLLGIGFISFSIALFRRLPNTKYGSYRWLLLSLLCLSGGIYAAYNHVHSITKEAKMRQLYTQVNNRYVQSPKMVIDRYSIEFTQQKKSVSAEVEMLGVALQQSNVFTFCLNPGLKVLEVTENSAVLPFERDHQILLVNFNRVVVPGDSVRFRVKYEGVVEEEFCYLDIPADILQQKYGQQMFNIDKKYSFQTENYLLFTPETYWYPRPGTSYSSDNPDWQQAYFSHFRLKVKTNNNLKALSQGTMKAPIVKDEQDGGIASDGVFIYETDFLTPSISLVIGDYGQKQIEVDEIAYSIWYLKGHDYFSTVFEGITDTIPAQIREHRRSIEMAYSLDYSFKRFSLVEVPVQFFSYVRTWTQAQEVMQPEMVLLPEKGSTLRNADVARAVRNEKNWAKHNGQELSDEEAAIGAFNSIMSFFQKTESDFDWSQNRGATNVAPKPNPYFIFPQLYNFRYNIFSSEWPIANRLIEVYLQGKSDNGNNWIRQMNGLSNGEKANLLMEKSSFKELLANPQHRDLLDDVISMKGNFLFAYAEQHVGYKEFRDSLRIVLQRNIFSNLRFENLLDTMGRIGDVDLISPLNRWNYPTPLPLYVIGTPQVTQITNRGKEVFVLNQTITNDSEYDGVIDVSINAGGRGGEVYDPRMKRKVGLKAKETKKMVSVWDEAPRSIIVNTLVSGNLPGVINLPLNNIVRERNKPIDEEGDFIVGSVSSHTPGEIIVDNEDSLLFVLSEPDVVGLLPQWLDRVDDTSFRYSGVSDWRPPLQWALTTNEGYYGTYIRSAYVIKSGSGTQTATWKIPVEDAGRYDLYYYLYRPEEIRRGWGRGGRGRGRAGGDVEYHFKVQYGNDEENAYINLQRSDDGWSMLGTYFFDKDTVRVVLSDDCKLRTVTADAVKLVKR